MVSISDSHPTLHTFFLSTLFVVVVVVLVVIVVVSIIIVVFFYPFSCIPLVTTYSRVEE